MKKLLAILLALFAIATMCVSCSKKEEEDDSWKDSYMQEDNENIDHIQVNDETFYFEAVDSESVAITGYQGSDVPHTLNIPETLNGKKVVEIADNAFYYCSKINAIVFPATVTKIGENAFAGCALITELELPATITSIGERAFYGCTGLTTLTLGNGFAAPIGEAAFMDCTALTVVDIPATVKIIETAAFFGCTALTSVTVAEGVEFIGSQSFQGCTALTTITLPASVGVIGFAAFEGCEDSLASATAPAGSYAETYINQYLTAN